jgi:hypothetical protein
MKEGATYEEAVAASNAAITRVAEAQDRMAGTVSALGGGLIKTAGGPIHPIIAPVKKEEPKNEEQS